MDPEVIIADNGCNFAGDGIMREEVTGTNSCGTRIDVHVEEITGGSTFPQFFGTPPVVVPPLYPPPVVPDPRENGFSPGIVPKVRDTERIPLSRDFRDCFHDMGETAHGTEDRCHVGECPPVNGIAPHGIEVVVRKVNDTPLPVFEEEGFVSLIPASGEPWKCQGMHRLFSTGFRPSFLFIPENT